MKLKARTNPSPSPQQELAGHTQVSEDRHSRLGVLTLIMGGLSNGVTFRFMKF